MVDDTMRAVRFHNYGSPDVLVVERIPRPEPGAGEVLVRVHAAGVNPIDWKIRKGLMRQARPIPLPSIPGSDLAGTVEVVGPGVTEFQPGQAVYGTGNGSYAEYTIAPAGNLAPMPRNLSFDQAASVPIGARTAWTALFIDGELQPGQRLLVLGAAGGVGLYGVQLGRWKGAQVTGTTSTRNIDFVRALGAAEVLDYTTTPLEAAVQDVDVVFDMVGGKPLAQAVAVVRPGGILVTAAGPLPEEAAQQRGVRIARVSRPPSQSAVLREITALIEAGEVKPVVGTVFPLEEARQSQALSEIGHGRGRIVLHISGTASS